MESQKVQGSSWWWFYSETPDDPQWKQRLDVIQKELAVKIEASALSREK
jgi:hypothetical protein